MKTGTGKRKKTLAQLWAEFKPKLPLVYYLADLKARRRKWR